MRWVIFCCGVSMFACSSSGGEGNAGGAAGSSGATTGSGGTTGSTGGTGGVATGGTGGAATGGTAGSGTGGSAGSVSTGGSAGSSTGGAGGSSGSAGAAGSAGASGAPSCECVGTPPPEWTGPVLLAEVSATGSLPGCPAEMPTQSTFNGDLRVADTTCECRCSDPSVFCGAYRVRESDGSCTPGGTSVGQLAQGECISVSTSAILRVEAPNPSLGMCMPQPTVVTPPPVWQNTAVACGGATTPCRDGVCIARSTDFSRLCIHRDGDVDCPGGRFSDKSVFYGDFSDDRTCTTCTCGDATGSCEGSVGFRSGGCTGSVIGSAATGACTSGSIAPTHAVGASFTTRGSCPPSMVRPMGQAAEIDPVTFCCEP